MSHGFSKKLAVVIAAVALSVSGSSFADERAQAAVETRQGVFKLLGFYIGPIVGMARQQIPFDASIVQQNAQNIAALAPMIKDVSRNNTSAHDYETEAKAHLWDNMDDYAAKADTLAEKASALAAAAEGADSFGAVGAAFGAMGGSCKACHDEYRQQ